jgi:hypothetical protein
MLEDYYVKPSTIEAVSVDLPKRCLQQAFPRVLWITPPSLPAVHV